MATDVERLARDVLAQRAARAGPHAVLSLPLGAAAGDVKARYKHLARLLHPDKARCAEAEEAFKAVQEAFTALSGAQAEPPAARWQVPERTLSAWQQPPEAPRPAAVSDAALQAAKSRWGAVRGAPVTMAAAWAPAAAAQPTAVPLSPPRATRASASAFAAVDDVAAAAPPPAAAPAASKWARAAPLVAPCHVTPPDEAAAPAAAPLAAPLPRHNAAPLRGWAQPAAVLYQQPVAPAAGRFAADPVVISDADDDDADDVFVDDCHDDGAAGAASDDDDVAKAREPQAPPESPPRGGGGGGAAGGRFARKRAAGAAGGEAPAAAAQTSPESSPLPCAATEPLQLEQATTAARAIGVYKRLRQGFTPRSPAPPAAPPAEPPDGGVAAAAGASGAPRRGVKKQAPTYQRSLAAFLTRR